MAESDSPEYSTTRGATRITTIEALREVFDAPSERSLRKEMPRLEKHSRLFIAKSPFVLMASTGPGGGDCSPKGDAPGFVHVLDDETLAIPDRRGNNRLDSLENLLADPAVGLLFLIPGADDTLRVNGRAELRTDPWLLERFEIDGSLPKIVILVHVESVYLHCAKALIRSKLWGDAYRIDRSEMPSFSRMIHEHIHGETCGAQDEQAIAAAEADYEAKNQRTLY